MYKTLFPKLLLFMALYFPVLQAQTFQDITLAAGIDHHVEVREAIGGGVAFFDFDNDGDEDIYLNGGLSADKLYQNNGDGTYTDIAFTAGLGNSFGPYTTSVITGDVDNDGYREIFVGTWDYPNQENPRSLFYKNNTDGTFTEMGIPAGLENVTSTMGASFFDVNLDGFLDLYTVSYILDAGAIIEEGVITGFSHECHHNQLFLNNGDFTFTDVTDTYGVDNTGCSLAVLASDYDQDGDQDLFLINDFGEYIEPNALFQNQYPNNYFTDSSPATGTDIALYGMGIASGDYNRDGIFDYYITNLGRNVLFQGDGTSYTDVATQAGVENTNTADGLLTTGWGTAFMDIDNDGWEDLFVANGRVPAAPFIATGEQDPNKLYRNNGDGTFEDISTFAGIEDINRNRGMAYADIDNDGDLDIMVNTENESFEEDARAVLYRNDNNNNNNWIKFKLTGVLCNRDAYGAIIRCFEGNNTYIREIHGGSSHASQHSSIVHIGLADAVKIDSIHIDWPGGDTQVLYELDVNQTHCITQELIPLPQDLLAFGGQSRANDILLQWKVTNEYNTKHYVIQKSDTGTTFDDLKTIPAQNGGASIVQYQHPDNKLRDGITYYYRLKIMDNNGAVSFSKIIALKRDEATNAPELFVFPNPAGEMVNIALANNIDEQEKLIEIFSAAGQKVYGKKLPAYTNPQIVVDITDLPKSIYFVKLSGISGQSFFSEFIKI